MGERPVRFDVNAPVEDAAPAFVALSEVVGFWPVLQLTPCAVGFGGTVPKSVIVPFPVAVVVVIFDTAWVVTVSVCAKAVHGIRRKKISKEKRMANLFDIFSFISPHHSVYILK